MTEEAEIWKPVVGYEGLYEVSSLGRVRSLERTCPCKPKGILRTRKVPARIMTPVERLGYTTVLLSKNAKKTKTLIHLIVLAAFVGPKPHGMQGCHGNGVRSDNRLSNLRYGTPSENAADKNLHGTDSRGEKTAWASLSNAQVLAVFPRLIAGESPTALANEFGVSKNVMCSIKSGKNWFWLTGLPRKTSPGR